MLLCNAKDKIYDLRLLSLFFFDFEKKKLIKKNLEKGADLYIRCKIYIILNSDLM
jgi:hypothetical protein